MLAERRVTALRFDASSDIATVVADGPVPKGGALAAQVLLDGHGSFVGLDLLPDGADRVVLMHGAHEAVARTEGVVVESDGKTITVRGARRALNADRMTIL
jgi:hypothetical protein